MSLLLTAAVCLASYGFYRYVAGKDVRSADMRDRCAYEAYVSLCENIVRGETGAAADALSRCELFSDCGEVGSLRYAILTETVDETVTEALALNGRITSSDVAEAVRRADRAAEELVGDLPRVLGETAGESSFWATLAGKEAVTEGEARKTAARHIGGGVSLTAAENHSFPLVYTFVCKNASADVTRMGGRLLRFYAFRHGDAGIRSVGDCRDAARRFIESAGIRDGVLLSETEGDDDVEFVFCGSFILDGVRVAALEETVTVRVTRAGAGVYFYDAYEYYKRKPVSYGELTVRIGCAEAARKLGVGSEYLSLVYTEERLFWRLGGVKTLLFDVETGNIRPQNP